MFLISFIVMLLGALGFLLTFVGFTAGIPVLDAVSIQVWAGVFIVAGLVAMFTRRPSN